jgi:hypothetical protein
MLLDTPNGHKMNQLRAPLGILVVLAETVPYMIRMGSTSWPSSVNKNFSINQRAGTFLKFFRNKRHQRT